MSERVDTVVVGAGQAGLSASFHLTRLGREHVLLERGSVAETWRTKRWDGFYLNTPNWATRLPGHPYAGPEPDAFSPLAGVIGQLETYAAAIAAPVRTESEVTAVAPRDGGFVVTAGDERIRTANVVVATGAFGRATRPRLAESLPESLLQLHASEYRRPAELPEGAVLIVGSGQSGCQIGEELLAAGRAVYLAVGRCPWFPRRYRGVELMRWAIDTGLLDETVDSLPSPAARLACNPSASGTEGGHDCNPRWLAERGAILAGRLERVEGSVLRFGGRLDELLRAGDDFVAAFRRRVDAHVATSGVDVPEEPPAEPAPSPRRVEELDVARDGLAAVIWASGYRPDLGWLGIPLDAQGWAVQRRGVTPVEGLYVVGQHWLHTRKSALLLGVGEDAEHVVDHLAARG